LLAGKNIMWYKTGMQRKDVTFVVGGDRCAAWLYLPDRPTPCPAVVMAHGFCATRPLRLDAYAQRFAAAGFVVFAFDYRHFGDSEGSPRQLLDIARQLDDWRAAIRTVKRLPEVDPQRVAVWGTSFSGGHVLTIAAQDPSLAACVAQVPFVDGPATARMAGPTAFYRLGWRALVDLVRGWTGFSPYYIPAVGLPGEAAAITTPDAELVEKTMVPPGVEWTNKVAARILLSLLRYRPGRSARRIQCPVLYCLAEHDQVTPCRAAVAVAERTPHAQVRRYPLNHFDIYAGEPFEKAVADQVEFLRGLG